jgi:hypothetical protein
MKLFVSRAGDFSPYEMEVVASYQDLQQDRTSCFADIVETSPSTKTKD